MRIRNTKRITKTKQIACFLMWTARIILYFGFVYMLFACNVVTIPFSIIEIRDTIVLGGSLLIVYIFYTSVFALHKSKNWEDKFNKNIRI